MLTRKGTDPFAGRKKRVWNIKSEKNFVYGMIATILALVCLAVLFVKLERRFFIAGILLLATAAVNYSIAFSKKGTLEKLAESADERDVYVTMKSSRLALKLLNYVLCAGCFVCLILYGAYKTQTLLIIALTLCAVLCLMFISMLSANIYCEKHS